MEKNMIKTEGDGNNHHSTTANKFICVDYGHHHCAYCGACHVCECTDRVRKDDVG